MSYRKHKDEVAAMKPLLLQSLPLLQELKREKYPMNMGTGDDLAELIWRIKSVLGIKS